MFSYKNKKILIVDDQKAFHVMLKTMLTNQGAKSITFGRYCRAALCAVLTAIFLIFISLITI